jgi:hypothetical protein
VKLGARLRALGLIDQAALDEALGGQMAYGARLGTNLVELCNLDLDVLAEALGGQHGMPAALSEHFERVDPTVQALLPAEVAAEWHAVPLYAGQHGIVLAVTDPVPTDGLIELGGYFGQPVVQAIAPEIRLLFHLEKAYRVLRTNRFRRVAEQGGVRDERRSYVDTLSDVEVPPEPPSRLARIAVKQVSVPLTGEGDLPDELTTVDGAGRAMRRATGRDRLAEIVIAALCDGFDRKLDAGMVVSVRRDVLFGWRGFVRDSDRHLIEAVALPLTEPSLFRGPVRQRKIYVGEPPEGGTALDHKLWLLLRTGAPAQLAVVPVELRGKVVGVIYAQADEDIDVDTLAGIAELGLGLAAGFDRLLRSEAR